MLDNIATAITFEEPSIVAALLSDQPHLVAISGRHGHTALHLAAISGRESVAAVLIQAGADITRSNDFGNSPLHCASDYGHVEIAYLLLIHNKLNVDGKNLLGHTALHRACRHGHLPTVLALLKHGADPSITDSFSFPHGRIGDGRSPLHFASIHASTAVVTALLRAGADANSCDRYGLTPMHLASQSRRPAVVECLLRAGAEPSVWSSGGLLALHLAARRGCVSCVQMLLQAGCDANAMTRSDDASSALHLAAASGAHMCVQALLRAGAHVSAKDSAGFTPLHIASAKGNAELISILLESESGRRCLMEPSAGAGPRPDEVACTSAVRKRLETVSCLLMIIETSDKETLMNHTCVCLTMCVCVKYE
jgi:ankyrin repeat protein